MIHTCTANTIRRRLPTYLCFPGPFYLILSLNLPPATTSPQVNVDDVLVYRGVLRRAPERPEGLDLSYSDKGPQGRGGKSGKNSQRGMGDLSDLGSLDAAEGMDGPLNATGGREGKRRGEGGEGSKSTRRGSKGSAGSGAGATKFTLGGGDRGGAGPRGSEAQGLEQVECFGQTVLFTNDEAVLEAELGRLYTPEELAEDIGVVFIDEGTNMTESAGLVRPQTAAYRNQA